MLSFLNPEYITSLSLIPGPFTLFFRQSILAKIFYKNLFREGINKKTISCGHVRKVLTPNPYCENRFLYYFFYDSISAIY